MPLPGVFPDSSKRGGVALMLFTQRGQFLLQATLPGCSGLELLLELRDFLLSTCQRVRVVGPVRRVGCARSQPVRA